MKQELNVNTFISFMNDLSIVDRCEKQKENIVHIRFKSGHEMSICLVIVDVSYPKQIKEIVSHIDLKMYHVILAPFISEQTAMICKSGNVGYLDLAGNCFIARDMLYIEIKGNKNTNVSKRGLKSIYERSSVVSSIILRIMMEDIGKVWKLSELANKANCSIGQVAKVKDFLLNQDYLEQTPNGIKLTNPKGLMKDWASIYSNHHDQVIECYSLDDISILEAKISKMKEDLGIRCILTGFSGGSRYQPVVRYKKVHAYIDASNMNEVLDYLNLKEVDSGANVNLIIPYDECVKYNATLVSHHLIVSPVQLYLDCMNIKGRGEEMAEAILEREICK